MFFMLLISSSGLDLHYRGNGGENNRGYHDGDPEMSAEKSKLFKLADVVTEKKHRAPRAEKRGNYHLNVLFEYQGKDEEHDRDDKTRGCSAARIGRVTVHEKAVISKNVSTVTDDDGITYYVEELIKHSRDKREHYSYYPCGNVDFRRKKRREIMSAYHETDDEEETEFQYSDYLSSEKGNAKTNYDKYGYEKNPRRIDPMHETVPNNRYIGI